MKLLALSPLMMLVVYVSAAANSGGGHVNQEGVNDNPGNRNAACKDCICCVCGDPNLVTCKHAHIKLRTPGDTLMSASDIPGNGMCNYKVSITLVFTGDDDHPNHYEQFGLKGTFGQGPTLHHFWINTTSPYPYVRKDKSEMDTTGQTKNFENYAGYSATISDSAGCMQLHVKCGVWFKYCPHCSCVEIRNSIPGVYDGVCGPLDGETCPQVQDSKGVPGKTAEKGSDSSSSGGSKNSEKGSSGKN